MSVIPFEQVLKEIEELQNANPDGFTTNELMEVTGHKGGWCRQYIRKMMDAG